MRVLDQLDAEKWLLRALLVGALVFYVMSLAVDVLYLSASVGMLFFAQPIWEDRSSRARKARLAANRAQLDEWERTMRWMWQWSRIEYLITPEWVL